MMSSSKRSESPDRLPRDQRWIIAVFFLMLAFPFFGVFPYIGVLMNPNENTRTYMTIAIVDHKTFQLDEVVGRFGWVNDMASRRGKDGVPHSYSVKGPLNSFMGVPVYWLQTKWAAWRRNPSPPLAAPPEKRVEWFERTTWVLRFFTVQLPCYLFLLWFERYLRGHSKDTALRLLAVAAAGVGTNYLGYAHMFVSHSLFAVAAFVGFGMAERELREKPDARERSVWAAFASGMGIAAATGFEYHGFFMSFILALFGLVVFYRPTRLLAYGFGAAIPMGLVAFYQWKAFGSPLTPGHKFVENAQWASEHARGLYGVILPTWKAIGALSFDPGYGFFGMSPYMLFGVFSVGLVLVSPLGRGRAARVQRVSTLVWFFAMMALWFTMAGAIEWRAGWTLGARRAGAAPPFFAMGALLFFERLSLRWPSFRGAFRGVSLGAALVGIVSLGVVGIFFNTLPEELTRPFREFTLPYLRIGGVPHHNAQLLGFKGTGFWYFVATMMVLAPVVAALGGRDASRPGLTAAGAKVAPSGRRSWWALVVALPVAIAAGYPAFHVPKTATPYPLDYWTQVWQPPRRDRIAVLANEVAKNPCATHYIADCQAIIRMPALAQYTRTTATVPQSRCLRGVLREWFP